MALTQLGTPYPVFTDKDGTPLDGGFLYFGEQNQNPETNPITVYFDAALTQAAAQPLRTTNGYVMRNGSPAILYAATLFSVTVRNARSELVIYAPVSMSSSTAGIFIGPSSFSDVSTLLADTVLSYAVSTTAGDIILTAKEGFSYTVAASGAADQDITTAGGVKLYANPTASGYDVLSFGAVGDGTTDDTTALQNAIDKAQDNGGAVYAPANTYATTGLTYNGDKPLHLHGDGDASFSLSALSGASTVFRLTASAAVLFESTPVGNGGSQSFKMFSCENTSGGTTEVAFKNSRASFCSFDQIAISDFNYGIQHQKSLYSFLRHVYMRGCENSFDFTNFEETAPFVLNSNFFNSVIHFDNCSVNRGGATFTGTGFALAGATIKMTACSAEKCEIGVKIAGADYNTTMVSIDEMYQELITGSMIDAENALVNIGTLIFASGTVPIGVKATDAKVNIGFIRAYGTAITVGIQATDSQVVARDIVGTASTPYTISGDSFVRLIDREEFTEQSFNLNQADTADFVLNSNANTTIAIDIYATENGGTRRAVRYVLRNNLLYSPSTAITNLTVAIFTNGSGNRDLRLTNSAGAAYNLTGYVKATVFRADTATTF